MAMCHVCMLHIYLANPTGLPIACLHPRPFRMQQSHRRRSSKMHEANCEWPASQLALFPVNCLAGQFGASLIFHWGGYEIFHWKNTASPPRGAFSNHRQVIWFWLLNPGDRWFFKIKKYKRCPCMPQKKTKSGHFLVNTIFLLCQYGELYQTPAE